MLMTQKGRVDVEFKGCDEAVYRMVDGVFTFIQGMGKDLVSLMLLAQKKIMFII